MMRADSMSISRRLTAEGIGTAFVCIAIVGSGILAERLASGIPGLALLANALASGAALFALISWFGPVSGAHFNPVITVAMACRGDVGARVALLYCTFQAVGAVAGVAVANTMFDLEALSFSTRIRSGSSQWLGEVVSTFGLVGAVWTCSRANPASVPATVATYITAAFWFTASSFANPAVTLGRSLTNTFSGIRPVDVPGFIGAEIVGACLAVFVFRWLWPERHHRSNP